MSGKIPVRTKVPCLPPPPTFHPSTQHTREYCSLSTMSSLVRGINPGRQKSTLKKAKGPSQKENPEVPLGVRRLPPLTLAQPPPFNSPNPALTKPVSNELIVKD